MNVIDYSPFTFDDASIFSGNTVTEMALANDTLVPDELTVEVYSDATGNGKLYTSLMEWYHTVDNRGYVIANNDLRKFTYGDPVLYYYDDVLKGKYFIRSVERLNKNRFKLSAFSVVGLWASITHMGGIYSGRTAGDVIEDIINGRDFINGGGSSGTHRGVTYTQNNNGSWSVSGTATAASFKVAYQNSRAFEEGIVTAGGTYYLKLEGKDVYATVQIVQNASWVNFATVTESQSITFPSDAVGLRILLNVDSEKTVNETVKIGLYGSAPRNFPYTIESDVASVPLFGWLPIASVRDNLQQVLFAIGASLTKDADGNPHIKFLTGLSPISVGDDRIFIGGKLTYKTPATEITVTEHTYYQSSFDIEVSLFDNTDGSGVANNKLVTFDEPCYDLKWNDLAIDQSWDHGANYCYVTGSGVLSGTKYTHTTKVFTVPTGVTGETREKKVENATLVSAVNSANVAARVSDYESTAEEVSCGIILDTDEIKPGAMISFTDPYNDASEGIIASMDVTMSAKSKGECVIVKGYVPAHFGNNFEDFDLLTDSGTWTAPKTGTIRIVLCQGGQGGQGGQNGTSGNGTSIAGSGGSGGTGGIAGKVFVEDIDVTQGDTFTYSVGFGGPGGVIKGEGEEGYAGFEGSHTTFGSYTSENGASPVNGYVNILTGEAYAENGVDGVQGGNGGLQDYGQDVTYNGQTWTGGWPLGSGSDRAGGGGAAYGESGHYAYTYSQGTHGGAGGNALPLPIVASLGSGGAGGNGGGGGGSGTRASSSNGEYGEGSSGNTGGDGFIIIYY